MNELTETAQHLVSLLQEQQTILVLAESCTAGLIAATIAQVPGASAVLAGSQVVYQVPAKHSWLGISGQHFKEHDVVSSETSEKMAVGVLERTEWAHISASITGHLGPGAPADLDGIAWCSIARRTNDEFLVSQTTQLQLGSNPELSSEQLRVARQQAAATMVLERLIAECRDSD